MIVLVGLDAEIIINVKEIRNYVRKIKRMVSKYSCIYKMIGWRYSYWKNKLGIIICRKCQKEIKRGEWVLSKKTRTNNKTNSSRNLYHYDCAEELYLTDGVKKCVQ